MSGAEGARPDLEKFDIAGAFADQEAELAAALRRGRGLTAHPTIIGDATEGGWRGLLRGLLPGRYGVVTGKVVDSVGHQSEQLDVIIYDTFYSPLIFTIGDDKFVPAESVYAVFEVKQKLNKGRLDDASKKAESVRRLHRTSALIPNQFGKEIRKDLSRFPVLAGLLASESKWTVPFDDKLEEHLKAQPADRAIDLGCALGAGAFDVHRESLVTDRAFVGLSTSVPERALSFFAMTLLHRLQALGTVGAIDYQAYATQIVADH